MPSGYQLSPDYVAAGYARPIGATPFRVPLVPAYAPCLGGNRFHGPPLAFSSCNPPQQTSGHLTVGNPNPTSPPANSVGSARYDVIVGNPATEANEADVRISMRLTDVRNANNLSDYTGQLQVNQGVRITDRHGGPSISETLQDTSFPITAPCAATAQHDDRRDVLGQLDLQRGRARRGGGGQARDLAARPDRGVRRRCGRARVDGPERGLRAPGRLHPLILN